MIIQRLWRILPLVPCQRTACQSVTSFVLLLLMFMGLPTLSVAQQACQPDGDVDRNGSVTAADALLAFQQALGLAQLTACQQDIADVFPQPAAPDGTITASDALCIFQKALGLPSCLDILPPSNEPPMVNAGLDQSVGAGTMVVLSGVASDSDGTIVSYAWEQVAGGTMVSLSGAGAATAMFTAPDVSVDETLTFRLTVTDDDGGQASAEVRVNVSGSGDMYERPPSDEAVFSIDDLGQLTFRIGGFTRMVGSSGCIIGDYTFNGVFHDLGTSKWQMRAGPTAGWSDIQGTVRTDDAVCGYDLGAAAAGRQYRAVLEITIGGDRKMYASNVITKPGSPDGTDPRITFESSTPPGYTDITLSDTGTVWGVPTRYTTDSSAGTVAYMVLGKVKGCSFANAEADRQSKVYVRTESLGTLSNFGSETVCRVTSTQWTRSWTGVRITHLRFFDDSNPTNVMEAIYNASTGRLEIDGGGSSSGISADLIVDAPRVSDGSPAAGESFTLSVTVRNQGAGSSAATTLRYYRSSDATIAPSDTEVGTDAVSGLAVAGTSDESIQLTAPSSAGAYYYGACVETVTDETDTANNCSTAVAVNVAAGDDDMAEVFDLHADNDRPEGIAYANNRVYVLDRSGNKVYAYRDSGQRDATADFNLHDDNEHPNTIAYANGRFYVIDEFDDKVYAYHTSGQRDETAGFDLHDDNGSPEGITYANDHFYVLDGSEDKVYAYWESGQRDAAADFDLHADNGRPGGIAFANDRFYVLDWSDDKVYAYWESGQRDAATDFELDADGGLAYGNNRFFVLDGFYDQIHVYPAPTEPDGPDLWVHSPSASASELNAGESFTFSATVRNRGNRPSAGTTLRHYCSSDPILSAMDTDIGTDLLSGLSASSTRETSSNVTAPADDGCYLCGVCADAVDGESVTSNNCSVLVVTRVGESTDLEVSRIVLHAPSEVTIVLSGTGSTPIKMTVDVTNNGPVASAPAKLKFSGGYAFERDIPALAPHETTTYDHVTVGGAELGTTTYRACISGAACDGDKTNNCDSRSVTYF